MDLRLDGKRVVLTAGAAGIGRITLQSFVDAGARVVTCDVDQAALDRLRGELPTVPAIPADVAEPADVDRLFELALEQLGGLDILINNAGIAGPTGPIEEIAPEHWRRTSRSISPASTCARGVRCRTSGPRAAAPSSICPQLPAVSASRFAPRMRHRSGRSSA
jgi:short chain dehydrogenase